MRSLLIGSLLAFGIAGCHYGSVYESAPRAVLRALREDFPERDCRRARGIERSGDRFEVRGCGRVIVYACDPGFRGECTIERVVEVERPEAVDRPETVGEEVPAGAWAPSAEEPLAAGASHVAPALVLGLDELVAQREQSQLGLGVGLLVAGPLASAGGLVLLVYESLRGARVSFGCWSPSGSCGEPPPRTIFPDTGVQILGGVVAGVGVLATLVGAIVLGTDSARHRDLSHRVTEGCTGVGVGAAGALAGLTLETCFP